MDSRIEFPYPGLRPFEVHESDIFFGRESHVDQLLQKLISYRFVVVVGPSGCGKSSLVRAGLIPALRIGVATNAFAEWQIAVMRPMDAPINNLAKALLQLSSVSSDATPSEQQEKSALLLRATLLRGPSGLIEAIDTLRKPATAVLIVVDQFEDVFRFTNNYQDEAKTFVDLLLTAGKTDASPIYVLLTIRSDSIGHCPIFFGLPEVLNAGQFLLPRLTRDQIRTAVEGPARLFNADVDASLVDRLLNDVGTEPDQLPLLQHVLSRVWARARWQGGIEQEAHLSIEHYEAVGGIKNALSQHADGIIASLTDPHQQLAETMFRCMVDVNESGTFIGRPTTITEIHNVAGAVVEEVFSVVEAFRGAGQDLIFPVAQVSLSPETVIGLSHEALLRNWQRLRTWTADEKESADRLRWVADAAKLWKKDAADLFQGLNLEIAMQWFRRRHRTQAWASRYGVSDADFSAVMQYLQESQSLHDQSMRQAEEARTRELDQARRLGQRHIEKIRSKIFLSYRRTDSSYIAQWLYERLARHFGDDRIFLDVDTIPLGEDFRKFIAEKLDECGVLLAIIGDNWLDSRFPDGPNQGDRRLDDPKDFVRIEIETALQSEISLIPILVGHASIPGQKDLPVALQAIVGLNAAEVRAGKDLHSHIERLIERVEKILGPAKKSRWRLPWRVLSRV
jgi:TIR domain/AAA ATPase domain